MKIQKFLKFGKEPHINELLQGKVYINHSSFFKKDIQHGIFDKNEGRKSLLHLKDKVLELRLTAETQWKKANVTTGKMESWNNLDEVHIFSLFQISEDETRSTEYFPFSNEIKKMGDYFLLINNPNEFANRMESALKKGNYCFESRSVNYYDPLINQENLSPFHKTLDYDYQKEFRYLIKTDTHQSIRMEVGSLSDISEVGEATRYKGLKFVWRD